MKYTPSALLTVVRTTPVLTFVAVTVTPGRTASPWSRTRPLNVLVAWAKATPVVTSTTDVTSNKTRFIRRPPAAARRTRHCYREPFEVGLDQRCENSCGIREPRSRAATDADRHMRRDGSRSYHPLVSPVNTQICGMVPAPDQGFSLSRLRDREAEPNRGGTTRRRLRRRKTAPGRTPGCSIVQIPGASSRNPA